MHSAGSNKRLQLMMMMTIMSPSISQWMCQSTHPRPTLSPTKWQIFSLISYLLVHSFFLVPLHSPKKKQGMLVAVPSRVFSA